MPIQKLAPKFTPAPDQPACEVEEHEAIVFATALVPVYMSGTVVRWDAVCDYHRTRNHGGRPSEAEVLALVRSL